MKHFNIVLNCVKKDYRKQMVLLFFIFISLLSYDTSAQLVNDFRVNDDTTNFNQVNAQLGVDKQGNFVIVWEDGRRNGRGNIYCQRFDSLAHRLGNNFIINTILDTASYPCISVRKDGSFGVCWIETNSQVVNRTRVKFRIFNKFGTPLSNEIILNDTTKNVQYKPSIGVDTTGKFFITFIYYWGTNYNYDVFYQKVDKFGNKIGNNIKVNDDTGIYVQSNPKIAVRENGSFIITWQDQRPPVPANGQDDIFMQMYDNNELKIGNNSRVNDIINLQDREYEPFISADSSGAFSIIFSRWNFYTNSTNAVIQFYDWNGIKIGSNNNIVSSTDAYGRKICKRENGDMIIAFTYYNGIIMRQYIQRRNSSGGIIGNVFQVSIQSINSDNWYCDGYLYKNNIINIISDNRNGNPDVFCNIRSFLNPDSTINSVSQISNIIPKEFKLFQNYPNPFNPTTKIKYQIAKTKNSNLGKENSKVSINVFDMLGKEVATLVNEKQSPGIYEVDFIGNNLSTGLYFYSLFVNGIRIDTKKFLYIK